LTREKELFLGVTGLLEFLDWFKSLDVFNVWNFIGDCFATCGDL
jgi:hypothetical protein